MDFDEDVELEVLGFLVEALEEFVVEGGDDEEDGIGSADDGFVNLDGVNGEVFPQERGFGEFGDLGEVAERAFEILLVGEDREAGCAAVEVAFGLADGVEIRVDDAGRGGGFLDFCDDAELLWSAVEGGTETPEIVALECGGTDVAGAWEQGFDFLVLGGDDFGEFVGHLAGFERGLRGLGNGNWGFSGEMTIC